MSLKHIRLEIENHKIAIAILVNDIVVFTNRYHQEPAANFTVNQWIQNGTNTFTANIAINPVWFEELKEQSFDMLIVAYEGTPENYTRTVLKEIHWKYSEDTQFPVNITESVEINLPFDNWTWFDADVLTDENFDINSLKAYIQQIHSALVNKDYESLAPFLTTKSTELAAAYSIPLEERFSDQKSFFTEELFCELSWGLQPINLDNLTFQYHANDRLIEVLDNKGKSPIQSTPLPDDVTFSLDLFLCCKDKKWILCR